MVPVLLVALLAGCLERVTGEAVPLDPRFYAGRGDGEQGADPNAGGTGDGAYVGYKGETVPLLGVVESPGPGQIQIDVCEFDPDAPGGVVRVGAIHLIEPGPFELKVPKDVQKLQLQAFQDPDVDGPSEQDPFAQIVVDLSGGPLADPVKLPLVVGARAMPVGGGAPGSPGGAPNGGGAPGSPGGDPNGAPAPPPPGLSFPQDGPRVAVSGTVSASRDLPVFLDFFLVDASAPGGRSYLGKVQTAAGAWTQKVPAELGALEIEAYQDLTGDSRTGDDPAARTERPVVVEGEDIAGIDLAVP